MKTSSRFGGQNRTGLALRTKLRVGSFLGTLYEIAGGIIPPGPIIPTLDSLPIYSPPSESET
jgi:hypothetical protein